VESCQPRHKSTDRQLNNDNSRKYLTQLFEIKNLDNTVELLILFSDKMLGLQTKTAA